MLSLYLLEIVEKKQLISSKNDLLFFNGLFYVCKSTHCASSKNHVLELFILHVVFLNSLDFFKYLSKLVYFISNGIQFNQFFSITKELSYLSNSLAIFSKKELKTTKKITTISIIIIGLNLLLIINIKNFEKNDVTKQYIDVIKTIAKFLEKAINPSIGPLMSFRLNDNDIIWNVGLGCESESINQGRSYVNNNFDISNCFFSRNSVYNGDGGVIFVEIDSYSMNINYSMFYNCVCSSWGGAIYFYSTNSNIRMICANSCTASGFQFALLQASQLNQVEYLSVSSCSHTTSDVYSTYLCTGNQRVDNTNSSMNNAKEGSGIDISSPSSFSSSHCAFSNNKVSDGICIGFYSGQVTISMSYAIIVHNNSPSQYGVVYVEGEGSINMMYCIYQNNQDYLFCVSSGSLEVSHSFIYHSASLSTSTEVSTSNNNSFTYRITYQLQFFNSLHCNTDIPLIETTPLITLEKSPIRSLEETIRKTNEETLRMTHENTIDQTIKETPINSPEITPAYTLNRSPFSTPEETPMNTINESPVRTPEETPMNTINESPVSTPEETPMNTINESPVSTPEETPMNTINESPVSTPEESPMNTINESPNRSNDDSNENKSNSILLYTTGGVLMIIVVVVYYIFGSRRNRNQNDHSSSSSSIEMEEKNQIEENSKKDKCNGNDDENDGKNDHHNYCL